MSTNNTEDAAAEPRSQILLIDEVAEMLRTTPSHVERLASQGQISSLRLGRYRRFIRYDIERYLDEIRSTSVEKLL